MGNVMNNISYGLYVLSVNCYKKDNACIINTVCQVASSPDRISISVNKLNHTCEMLDYTDEFTVSVISEDADFSLFKRFGFVSGRDTEKFEGFENVIRLKNGTLAVTEGTNSYISARVVEKHDMGSHILFIAEITESGSLSSAPSATYGYYHAHIKPKPVEGAEKKGKTVWRCRICGYEYDGEDLPEDFICPTCKHGVSDFERVTV